MLRKRILFLPIVLLILLPARLLAGTLPDPFTPAVPATQTVSAVSVQLDGKILVAGLNMLDGTGIVARYHPDGSKDTAFAPPALDSWAMAVVALPDGKILVGGGFTNVGGAPQRYLARLNSDGTNDPTFVPATVASMDGYVMALVPLPGGKFLAGGYFSDADGGRNFARFLDDGAIDPGFPAKADDAVDALALQGDGKIVLGGWFTSAAGVSRDNLARVNADGTIDEAFAPVVDSGIETIALESDGGIIIGGFFESVQGVPRTVLARLNKSGNLDASFDPQIPANPIGFLQIYSVAVQPDGRILVGGDFDTVGGAAHKKFVRLTRSGVPDGSITEEPDSYVTAVLVQPDGKVLIGGTFTAPTPYLARYYESGLRENEVSVQLLEEINSGVFSQFLLPSGEMVIGGYILKVNGAVRNRAAKLGEGWSLDNPFNPNLDNRLSTLLPLRDGRVLLAGNFWLVGGTLQKYLAVVNGSTGALDPTFRPAINAPPGEPLFGKVEAIAQQPDDKILIGGNFTEVNGVPCIRIARLDLNGNLDPTFHPPALDAPPSSFTLLPDRKIIVAGAFTGKILRLNEDGTPDADFQSRLPVIRYAANDDFGADPLPVFQVIPQVDGKYVAVGIFDSLTGPNHQNLLRLNNDGSLDPSFRVGVNTDIGDDSRVYGGAMQADGRLVFFGRFTKVYIDGVLHNRTAVARLNPDGTLDESFNLDLQGNGVLAPEVAVVSYQQDGKMLIGGNFAGINGVARSHLARVYNGGASQELTLSNDGTEVRWMRSGGPRRSGGSPSTSPPTGRPGTGSGMPRGSPGGGPSPASTSPRPTTTSSGPAATPRRGTAT